MTHHTWKHRFIKLLKSRNWKKLIFHQCVEYSVIGAWYVGLEHDPSFWIYGIISAIFIHFVVFEAIDALYSKDNLPSKLKWFFKTD